VHADYGPNVGKAYDKIEKYVEPVVSFPFEASTALKNKFDDYQQYIATHPEQAALMQNTTIW